MANRTIEAGTLRGDGAQSLAIRAGQLVFLSGFTAEQAGSGPAEVERMPIEEQSSAAFEALDQALSALGSRLDRAAKVKAYLGNMGLYGRYRSTADTYLHRAPTVHSVVGVSCGATAPLVTVEVIGGAGAPQESYRREASTGISASRLGPLVFSGGCAPVGAEGMLVGPADLRAQARQALENLKAAIELGGARLDDVAKVNNTAASWHNYSFYNEIYNQVLEGSSSARCSVSGALIDPYALIEVEAIAVLGANRRYVDSVHTGADRVEFTRNPDTVYLPNIGPCKGPHTHGARIDDLVFIAGECPFDRDDRLVGPGDIGAQTRQTMINVQTSLEALGVSLDDVVKTNVTLSDMRLFAGFEAAYARFFNHPYPSRTVVATPLGQYGILVEIEAIAVVGAADQAVALVGKS